MYCEFNKTERKQSVTTTTQEKIDQLLKEIQPVAEKLKQLQNEMPVLDDMSNYLKIEFPLSSGTGYFTARFHVDDYEKFKAGIHDLRIQIEAQTILPVSVHKKQPAFLVTTSARVEPGESEIKHFYPHRFKKSMDPTSAFSWIKCNVLPTYFVSWFENNLKPEMHMLAGAVFAQIQNPDEHFEKKLDERKRMAEEFAQARRLHNIDFKLSSLQYL